MWVYDVSNLRFLRVNDCAIEHYGYTRDEFARMRLRDIVPAGEAAEAGPPAGGAMPVEHAREARHRTKSGAVIDVVTESTPMQYGAFNARLAIVQDVTERRQSERREHSRTIVMELLTEGAPLARILEAVIRGVESANTAMLCSILLLDKRGERLYTMAAPSLPATFSAAVDGLEIGVGAGSCGTAASTGKQVIVDDVQTHPYWAPYREIAARANLRACWSEPIRAASGKVLGTFAIYYREIHRPSAFEIAWVRQFVDLAGLALERVHAADALRASEARFRSLTHLGADWYWEQDEQYRFTEISEGIFDHSGIAPASFIGKTRWECEPPGSAAGPMRQHREQLARHEAFHDLQIERINANGERRIFSVSGEPVFGPDGSFKGFRGVGSDITERKRMERELRELATTDSLTGLANRRQFLLRVEHELARLQRSDHQPTAVLMIDLDHFKRVNDRYGHAVGDEVLRHYALLLEEAMRTVDLAGRMGGEEFAILLPGADASAGCAFAERLRVRTAASPLIHDGQVIAVTASFGVAAMKASDMSASDVLKRADAALYRAKQGGRNQVAGPPVHA
jgi:diguanylate cyclase (GGDEF)-like protein/PAS domain S-box-containing protein